MREDKPQNTGYEVDPNAGDATAPAVDAVDPNETPEARAEREEREKDVAAAESEQASGYGSGSKHGGRSER